VVHHLALTGTLAVGVAAGYFHRGDRALPASEVYGKALRTFRMVWLEIARIAVDELPGLVK
jgi:hypothetical protein